MKTALLPKFAGWHPCRRWWFLLLALAGGGWPSLAGTAGTNAPLVWPPPPAAARIAYVRQITGATDVGVRPSVTMRLANWLTGVANQSEKLDRPFGLSLDETENLVVTDTAAGAVNYLDLAHKKWRRWTRLGSVRLLSPVAAVHRAGIFWAADSVLGSVIAFDEQGQIQLTLTNQLERPAGLAFVGDRLLVVDSQRHQVVIFNPHGESLGVIGRRGTGPGEFNFPTHISVDRQNRIYVTDAMNSRIQIFDAAGKFLRAFGSAGDGPGRFSRPKGVAVDGDGHIYVVDGVFGNVQIFDDEARLLLDWGGAGSVPGRFCLPNAIVINSRNEIFVADAFNHRLQEFRYLHQP